MVGCGWEAGISTGTFSVPGSPLWPEPYSLSICTIQSRVHSVLLSLGEVGEGGISLLSGALETRLGQTSQGP